MNEVHHDPEAGRFSIVTDGVEAVADYSLTGDRVIFTHTYVPPALRGKGLAAELIEAGMKFARSEGHKVVPQCSYVDTYLRRHPEYADLRA
jgi:predicted GNAT family acetyltransferase